MKVQRSLGQDGGWGLGNFNETEEKASDKELLYPSPAPQGRFQTQECPQATVQTSLRGASGGLVTVTGTEDDDQGSIPRGHILLGGRRGALLCFKSKEPGLLPRSFLKM